MLYRLGDRVTLKERKALGVNLDAPSCFSLGNRHVDGIDVRAEPTGEFRPPKKDEWYLSGAEVLAYKAPNDLNHSYHIAHLVKVERKTTVTVLKIS